MSESGSIPRWRSLGPFTLFTSGPWEIVLPVIAAGALVAAAWIVSPRMRLAAVLDWRIAAVCGAALAAMISIRAFARIWSDARGAWPFVLASTVAGAVIFAAASQTLFAPALARASDCAPLVVTEESRTGLIASYVLPIATWIAWVLYLLTRFPRIENVSQLMHGRDSRYRPYARALRLLLPMRLLLSAILIGVVGTAVYITDLAPNATALLERTRSDGSRRTAEEQKALMHLAALELDDARASVRRCACDWLRPGDKLDPRVAAAETAFRVLDREIDELSFAWKPSATTGAAVIRLLPLGSGYDDRPPLYPLLWQNSSPPALPGARATSGDPTPVMYRNETVMLLRRSTIATVSGEVLAEVGVKLLGRGGRDPSLPTLVTERVQMPAAEGPCPLAGGSYCAVWSLGRLKLRLGPDEAEPITPDAPLWLTLSDPAYVPARSQCCVRDSAAASR